MHAGKGRDTMAAKKVGTLIREARTAAGFTQEKLANAAGENLTASMIGKCERGEEDLTNNQLKRIAVACGVTQSSLLNAPKNLSAADRKKKEAAEKKAKAVKTASTKTSSAKSASSGSSSEKAAAAKSTAKSSAAKTAAAKSSAKTSPAKTAAKSSASRTAAAKKKAASSSGSSSSASTSVKLTAAEKKLIDAYRESTAVLKKAALKLLQGEYGKDPDKTLKDTSSSLTDDLPDMIGDMLSGLLGKK